MRLLVSVVGADEAAVAVSGGADIVDVKNPHEGSLGAAPPWVIEQVRATVPPGLPVSAAIGDLPNLPGTVGLAALGAARCGAVYVKVGLHGPMSEADAVRLVRQAQRSVSACAGAHVVPVAYADAERLPGRVVSPLALPRIATSAGVDGCLIDTAAKDGRRLLDWLSPATISDLVHEAHTAGLWIALAGSLRVEDIPEIERLGADIAGVRSAACRDGRRRGRLDVQRVRGLSAAIAVRQPLVIRVPLT